MVTVKMKGQTGTNTRRRPIEVLKALENRRAVLVARQQAQLAKLDEKISRVTARFEKSIEVAKLQSQNPEELRQRLEATRKEQRLIRRALRGQA